MVTFTVTNTNDNGVGSLRQAIEDANSNDNDGTQDVIRFDISDDATIILTGGELDIAEDLFVDGSGQTIDAERSSRIFEVNEEVTASIDDLTLARGYAGPSGGGGAIRIEGNAYLSNSLLTRNEASYGGAVAIMEGGVATVNNTLFDRNSAFSSGAIENRGSIFIFDSRIENNGSVAPGGGIGNTGVSILENVIVEDNSVAAWDAGAIYNLGDMEILQSIIFDNSSVYSAGAIENRGHLKIRETSILENVARFEGGAILNSGDLHISESLIDNNSVLYRAGGISNSGELNIHKTTLSNNYGSMEGGALLNRGTAGLYETLFAANTAYYGGAVFNSGELAAINSTFHNNDGYRGGALENSSGVAEIVQSTFSGNEARYGGGIYSRSVSDGGLTLINSILANSSSGEDFGGGGLVELIGQNLVEDGSLKGANVLNEDPRLGSLQDNGGPTESLALTPGSPAVDAGDNGELPFGLTTDQRGQARIVDGDGNGSAIVDLGAFEFGRPETFIVTNTNDSGAGSLRQAILDANNNSNNGVQDVITFAIPTDATITLSSGNLEITEDLFIDGSGQTIDANNTSRVFLNDVAAITSLENLAVTGGRGPGPYAPTFYSGGGISNRGQMVLNGVIVTENDAGFGGGVENDGEIFINNSQILNNIGTYGGGIVNNGSMTLLNSTVAKNSALIDGGITNSGNLLILNSTVSENSSILDAGGITNNQTIEIIHSTISNNISTYRIVGGIDNFGALHLTNSIIANNTYADYDGDFIAADIYNGTAFGQSGTVATYGVNIVEDGSVTGPNVINADPLLGPLQDNGGPTPTQALLAGSPAIDAGDNGEVPVGLVTDQRGFGFPRIVDGNGNTIATVDLGAFEAGAEVVVLPFPELVERQAVPSDAINGVNPALLVGDGSEIQVEFQLADAELQNSLGFYTYEADGVVANVTLLDANLADTEVGTRLSLGELPDGQAFGFFLAVNGFEDSDLIRDEGLGLNGSLTLVERNSGATGTIDSQERMQLAVEDVAGLEIIEGVPIFHASTFGGAAGNPLNLGGEIQALSGINEDGNLQIAFEDVSRGDAPNLGNSDEDFNDAVIELIRLPSEEFNGSGGYFA